MKDKKVKIIVLIIGIIILLILLGIFAFNLFKSSIINEPYISFGDGGYGVLELVPASMDYKSTSVFWYIDKNGFIVKELGEKAKLIGKISTQEVKELEQYIIERIEKSDSKDYYTDYMMVVKIKDKVESHDRTIVGELMDRF